MVSRAVGAGRKTTATRRYGEGGAMDEACLDLGEADGGDGVGGGGTSG